MTTTQGTEVRLVRCENGRRPRQRRAIRRTSTNLLYGLVLISFLAFGMPFSSAWTFRYATSRHSTMTRQSLAALYMASSSSSASSNSKTGCRLLESADEYATLVMDNSMAERPMLVFWTAPWCGPCRLSIPVVKDVIKAYATKVDAVEVCTDDLPEVAADAGVLSIPTIHIYYQGKLLDTLVGCVAKQVLAGSVEKVLEDIALRKGGSSSSTVAPMAVQKVNEVYEDMAP